MNEKIGSQVTLLKRCCLDFQFELCPFMKRCCLDFQFELCLFMKRCCLDFHFELCSFILSCLFILSCAFRMVTVRKVTKRSINTQVHYHSET